MDEFVFLFVKQTGLAAVGRQSEESVRETKHVFWFCIQVDASVECNLKREGMLEFFGIPLTCVIGSFFRAEKPFVAVAELGRL